MKLVAPLTLDSNCGCTSCVTTPVKRVPAVVYAHASAPVRSTRQALTGGVLALRHLFDVPIETRLEVDARSLLFRGRLGVAVSFDEPTAAYVDRFELDGRVDETSGRSYGTLSVTSTDGPATRLVLRTSEGGRITMTGALGVHLFLQRRLGLDPVVCDSARAEVHMTVDVAILRERPSVEELGVASLGWSVSAQTMGGTLTTVAGGQRDCDALSEAARRVVQTRIAAARIRLAEPRRDVPFRFAYAFLGRRIVVQPHFVWESNNKRDSPASRELVRDLVSNGIRYANEVWNKVGVVIDSRAAMQHVVTPGAMRDPQNPGSADYSGNESGYDPPNTSWMQETATSDPSVTHVFYFRSFAQTDSKEGETPGVTLTPRVAREGGAGAPNAYIVTSQTYNDFGNQAKTAKYHLAHELGHVLGLLHPAGYEDCFSPTRDNRDASKHGSVNGSPDSVMCPSVSTDEQRSKNSVWNGLYATKNSRMQFVHKPFVPEGCDPRTPDGANCPGKFTEDQRMELCSGRADRPDWQVGCG